MSLDYLSLQKYIQNGPTRRGRAFACPNQLFGDFDSEEELEADAKRQRVA